MISAEILLDPWMISYSSLKETSEMEDILENGSEIAFTKITGNILHLARLVTK